MTNLFHISLPCVDVLETKNFYTQEIGAEIGRSSENWVDVNLFGHQLTFTKAGKFNFNNPNYVFEGKILPSFHFGIIVDVKTWGEMYSRLNGKDLSLVTQATFLKDKSGEHLSFFVKDPNEYMLEFKSFKDPENIFKD
ncbi:MAG: bleomycin resistance protein [Bacteroidia bacterium]|nr:bleomycin resistance protein [Bacteroidia bacterium]NND25118.1 bleomycin resistance protein [Flavobacteriaceae bacterium]MBT8277355.1 bleomycin resistance protein [Bacteroidia bacterium]NNK60291.1 bleomycin resistance protein [Flavobacteriaceae bacterium]NNL32667.1 bleomycin resistance protein [Flavobacteriaceae bacterium]